MVFKVSVTNPYNLTVSYIVSKSTVKRICKRDCRGYRDCKKEINSGKVQCIFLSEKVM